MLKDLLHKISNKYASKWLVLLFDISVTLVTFFLAYVIRFNFKLTFDFTIFFKQIPVVFIIALVSFLLVGSQREEVRSWNNIKEVVVKGNHFIQEDSPDEITAHIKTFLAEL